MKSVNQILPESMKAPLRHLRSRVLWPLRSQLKVLKGGLHYVRNIPIQVSPDGFWHPRSCPYKSLIFTAYEFDKMKGKVIIEVGSGIQGEMSGNSMLVWTRQTKAERIIALDLDEKQIESVKSATKNYDNVEAIVVDGIKYLDDFQDKIDLLYLDFWTSDPENTLPGTGRANAYQEAFDAAREKLNKKSIILIDDTDHIHPWKHTKIIPSARKEGFRVIYTGRQTMLKR